MGREELETPRVDDPGFRTRTVYVCMPTRGSISIPTHNFLMNKEQWCQRANVGNYQEFCPTGMAVQAARETALKLVDEHRRQKPDNEAWILWMDDDMDPPHFNTVSALRWAIMYSEIHSVKHNNGATGPCGECSESLETPVAPIGICSAWCSRKELMDTGLLFAPETKVQMVPKVDFQPGEIIEVEWCGLGFALMRSSWLDKFPAPRFSTANDGGGAEDHDFTLKLRALGCIPYVHTGVTVGHFDTMRQSVFYPYVTPTPKTANGKQVEPFIPAWMTCGMPDLHSTMYAQFADAKRSVAFDNGGEPQAKAINEGSNHACRIIRADRNLLWANGFNAAMNAIIELYPDAKAVWLCNDDITGVSVDMGKVLYKRLMDYPNVAAVSPAIIESKCPESTPLTESSVRKVHFIDFVAPMISVAAWKQVGPLDSQLMGNGWGNDMEWAYRADKAGYQLLVDDSQRIHHANPSQTCIKLGTLDLHITDWVVQRAAFKQKHGVELEDFVSGRETANA